MAERSAARLMQRARLFGVALVVATITACGGGGPERRTFELRGPTMGTTFSVKIVTGAEGLSGHSRAALDEVVRLELDRINALVSTWDRESELSRFNEWASLDPFPVSTETFELFDWALQLAKVTGGALDVTIFPLVDAWGFGPSGRRDRIPSAGEIARLREAVGVHHLTLDAAARTVRKLRKEVRCDFSALAPGYAADRLWTLLSAQGLADFLVDVGGELRVRGRNDAGTPWQIAVERPEPGGQVIERMVPISNLAIATSGDYRNYYEVDGERVAHILDSRTGRPIRHSLASVTVIDELAVRADGLSTALMVLGPDEGFALAERLDLAALFIVRRAGGGFAERATRRFDALVNE
jgi:thiamine biosynthesis lipoprotein